MWIWFNKNGVLVDETAHGSAARVGTTNFQIFAYFDGLDITEYYTDATIRFRRPDLQGSEYPSLFMRRVELTYVKDSSDSDSVGFQNGQEYTGFMFDFGDFQYDEDYVTLLDAPGLWEATITLYGGNGAKNVVGIVTFNVQDSVSVVDNDPTVIDPDVVLDQLRAQLGKKLDKESVIYARINQDLATAATEGTLSKANYVVGTYVIDMATNAICIIDTVTETSQGSGYVTATYTKVADIDAANCVPYSGATNNVDLGSNKIKAKELDAWLPGQDNGIRICHNFIIRYTLENDYMLFLPEEDGVLATQGWVNANIIRYTIESPETNYSVGTFITNHPELLGKIITLNIWNNSFIAKLTGTASSCTFELLSIDAAGKRLVGANVDLRNVDFGQFIMSDTYSLAYQTKHNMVPLESGNTVNQYPNAKSVWNNLQNVREIAEGKTNAYVLKYSQTAPTQFSDLAYITKFDGTPFTNWQDFIDYITIPVGPRPQATLGNNIFNSSDSSVSPGGDKYFITYDGSITGYQKGKVIPFTMPLRKGDIIYIIETDVPDRWFDRANAFYALETKSDLSGYVDLSSDQTITGVKTFTDKIILDGARPFVLEDYANYTNISKQNTSILRIGINSFDFSIPIKPINDNTIDLGSGSLRWKDLYLSGELKDGTNSVSVADIANGTFNVINASDIVDNTLTQAQYDLFTNGKPTLISGTNQNLTDIVLVSGTLSSNNEFRGPFMAHNRFGQAFWGVYIINANKVISYTKTFYITPNGRVYVENLYSVNNKGLPDYPTTNTSPQYLQIGANGGDLSWVDAPTRLYKHHLVDSSAADYAIDVICDRELPFLFLFQTTFADVNNMFKDANAIKIVEGGGNPMLYDANSACFYELILNSGSLTLSTMSDWSLSDTFDTVTEI